MRRLAERVVLILYCMHLSNFEEDAVCLLNRENKENRQVVLTIQVEQSAWEKALEDAYEQSKSLFKKEDGSLPTRQEMEEKHGADVFYQDAVNSTFPVALWEAVRQEDISVARGPGAELWEAIGPEAMYSPPLLTCIRR